MSKIIKHTDDKADYWVLSVVARASDGTTLNWLSLTKGASSEMEAKGVAITEFMKKFPGSSINTILVMGLSILDEETPAPLSP